MPLSMLKVPSCSVSENFSLLPQKAYNIIFRFPDRIMFAEADIHRNSISTNNFIVVLQDKTFKCCIIRRHGTEEYLRLFYVTQNWYFLLLGDLSTTITIYEGWSSLVFVWKLIKGRYCVVFSFTWYSTQKWEKEKDLDVLLYQQKKMRQILKIKI